MEDFQCTKKIIIILLLLLLFLFILLIEAADVNAQALGPQTKDFCSSTVTGFFYDDTSFCTMCINEDQGFQEYIPFSCKIVEDTHFLYFPVMENFSGVIVNPPPIPTPAPVFTPIP